MFCRVLLSLVCIIVVVSPACAERKTFDSSGMKISYLDQGSGEVVVLLHGLGSSASETWQSLPFTKTQLLHDLAKEYRVIAPDLRGHGKSDQPHDSTQYGEEMALDVIRLLDHLKIKKAHVVGYSLGSAIAGKILVDHPDRLLSVVFGGGGPLFRQPKAFTDAIDATAESLEQGKGIGPLLIALFPEGQPKPSPEQAAAISKQVLGDKDQKAFAAVLRGQVELVVTEERLEANEVHVLFVYGSRDTVLKELAAGSLKVIPASDVQVVEGGDHMSTIASSEFRRAVLNFIHATRVTQRAEPISD